MIKAYCILNHSLTEKQIKELKEVFCVDDIIYPSEKIATMWAQIKPELDSENYVIDEIVLWLKSVAHESDIILIQGEFGATFTIVDFALKNKLVPIYATTKRVETEECNGEIISRHYIFEHVCFKKYKYYINYQRNKLVEK